MAPRKKAPKKSSKPKKTASPKINQKKQARKKAPKKAASRKVVQSRPPAKSAQKKRITASARGVRTPPGQKKGPGRARSPLSRDVRGPGAGGQSGDLQGLSNREAADSESVDELLEEGNAFEAGVVSGVEEADEREGREVRTSEVPEDDVPAEYLDEE